MPSDEFDPFLALVKIDPGLVATLLSHLFGVEVPDYHHARPATTSKYEFHSEMMRNAAARGEARAILTVLEGRGVAVPDDVRDQVLECKDTGQLDIWLRRAITATTVDDVIG